MRIVRLLHACMVNVGGRTLVNRRRRLTIEGSLTTAMQSATSGLSKWLAMHYGLSSPEITTVLANTVHYDIAEAGDPHIHVVAKIGKDVLQQIRAP